MFQQSPTPRLIQLYFNENAESAWLIASDRLKHWSLAFDDWLSKYKPGDSRDKAVEIWRRLARERRQLPWMLTRHDIEQHMAWMRSMNYAPKSITNALAGISSFYRWCSEKGIDPECGADFNPAAEVSRTKVRRYAGGELWSREEIGALLGILGKDETPLGKRDYAFFLARIRLGVPHKALQHLRWKQIEQAESEVWVRWPPSPEPVLLPADVWDAIKAYLEASGRLECISSEEFIFAPSVTNVAPAINNRREDWDANRCLSLSQHLKNLKTYGSAAFIDEDKLSLQCLLNTAVRMRLDEGVKPEEMQAFMNSQSEKKHIISRMKHLPEIPEDSGLNSADGLVPPNRIVAKPGDGIKHGQYAQKLPEEDVQAVLDENVEGLEEELVCMRRLARGLISAQKMTSDRKELAAVLDGYTMAATRVAGLIDAEKELAETPSEPEWLEGHLKMLDGVQARMGREPLSDRLREMFQGAGYEPSETDRKLEEEIAAVRFILRNIYIQAEQTLEEGHIRHYANLVTMYGRSCSRLISLLKKRVSRGSALADFVWETWEESKQMWLESKGWGGDDPINNPQPPVIYVDGEGSLKTSLGE